MNTRLFFIRTTGLVAAAAALVAGCSTSPGASTSPAGDVGSATAAAKLTGSPIKIGLISTLSGAQASAGNQGAVVAPAWAKWINAHGGINGHPFQIFSEDDGSDPVKAQAAEKKLIDEDNVIALVVATDTLISVYDSDAI